MLILGIDEAGRGPVLGPMVVAGFAIRARDLPALQRLGVKDSKVLSRRRRGELAAALADLGALTHLVEIPPAEMDRRNLTDLELEAFAACVEALRPAAVYADAPVGPRGIPRFRDRLLKRLHPLAPDLTLENRADARFPVVSAASILAKVTRDARVAEHAAVYGEIGSGYPSDPVTRRFLLRWREEKGGVPPIARARWATFQRLSQARFAF